MRKMVMKTALVLLAAANALTVLAATVRVDLSDGWKFRRNEGGGNNERDFQLERMSAWLDDMGREYEAAPRPSRRPVREPGENHRFAKPDFDDSGWRTVSVPHDWGVEGDFNRDRGPEEALLDIVGIGWYRRTLPVDPSWKRDGKRVFFACDGACGFVMVWLNGAFVGGWPSSHTPWRIDLTDWLREDGPNVLAVRVQQFVLANRWYSGAGLTRTCALEVRPKRHVVPDSVFITTPEVSRERATVRVTWRMSDGERRSDSFAVVRPRLWDVDDPFLYTYELEGDAYRYGIRSIRWTADDGFHLNGRRVYLKGMCVHQDLGPLGNAWNRGLWKRRLEQLRSCGVNAIRMSHYRHAAGLYDLCDELGLLVMDEFFDQWELGFNQNDYHRLFPDWHERDLRASMRADRNHPSIVLWSLGNEITEQRNDVIPGEYDRFERWGRRLLAIAHEEDPTRPCTTANNGRESWRRSETQFVDIYGFNYDPGRIADYHRLHPDKPMVSTETACLIGSRGEYFLPLDGSWKRVDGHSSSYCLKGILTPEAEWRAQDETPAFAGSFYWTGFDYLGGPFGTVRAGVHTCSTGLFDLGGVPRDACWLYRSRFCLDERFVHLLPHWNWPDRMDQVVPVMAFSSADEAELFLNGKSLGRQRKARGQYRFRWDDVVYAPGALRCVTYKNGEYWAEETVETTGKPVRLAAEVEPHGADDDVVRINVRTLDDRGRIVPRSRVPVRISVSGGGRFLGATNGDEADLTAFGVSERNTFNGWLSVLIRRLPHSSERIVVRLDSTVCGSETVSVRPSDGR